MTGRAGRAPSGDPGGWWWDDRWNHHGTDSAARDVDVTTRGPIGKILGPDGKVVKEVHEDRPAFGFARGEHEQQ